MGKRKKAFILIIFVVIVVLAISLYLVYLKQNTKSTEPKEKSIEEILAETQKVSEYNNPIVPEGFKKVDTESASWVEHDGIIRDWNKGLVIEDELGNQFVWIPIEDKYPELSSYVFLPEGILSEKIQIKKYGGFYIGRYEAGLPEDMQNQREGFGVETNNKVGIPVTKKDSIIWNYISAMNAKASAESMYKTENIQSGLMTYSQYKSIRDWIAGAGYNVTDCKEWGNFSNVNFRFTGLYSIDDGQSYQYGENKLKATDNMLLSTGATDRNMAKNIYDLVGNLHQFTSDYHTWAGDNKIYNSSICVGGYYDNISTIKLDNYAGASRYIGFRVVLFIK